MESDLYMKEITCPVTVKADLNSPGSTLQDPSFASSLYIVGIINYNSGQLIINF